MTVIFLKNVYFYSDIPEEKTYSDMWFPIIFWYREKFDRQRKLKLLLPSRMEPGCPHWQQGERTEANLITTQQVRVAVSLERCAHTVTERRKNGRGGNLITTQQEVPVAVSLESCAHTVTERRENRRQSHSVWTSVAISVEHCTHWQQDERTGGGHIRCEQV